MLLIYIAYVIDTGVSIKHSEFEGRAFWGATIPENDEDVDGHGHGTHVAGTIASKTYGVAKKAKVVAVKVLRSNGSGSMSDVLAGVEWAVDAMKLEEEIEKEKGNNSTYKASLVQTYLTSRVQPLTCPLEVENPQLSIRL
jgi:cerevisin